MVEKEKERKVKKGKKKKVDKIPKADFEKVPTMLIVNDRDIAMDFASKVYKKFERMIQAIVMFGSSAKNDASPHSDIDLVILLDDVSIRWDENMVTAYREELGKIVQENPYIKSLHVNTIKISTWWQDLVIGDPVVLNVIRYGTALIDHGGFFVPQKALLAAGKIRPSPEAVFNLLERTTIHLSRAKTSFFSAVDGYYWACVDSAHAALMAAGLLPPSPEHVAEMLDLHLVKERALLSSKFVRIYEDVYSTMKAITRGDLTDISGKKLDELKEDSEAFVIELTKVVDKIIQKKYN